MTPPPKFLPLEHDMNYMYINYKPIHYYTVLDKKLKLALVYLKIDILKFYTIVNNAQSVNFSVLPPPPYQ